MAKTCHPAAFSYKLCHSLNITVMWQTCRALFIPVKMGHELKVEGKFQAAGSCGNIILCLELWWKLSLNMQECCVVILLGFRKMQLKLPKCDCVVEVHDARISFTLILIDHSGSRTFHLFCTSTFNLIISLSLPLVPFFFITNIPPTHSAYPCTCRHTHVNQGWGQH